MKRTEVPQPTAAPASADAPVAAPTRAAGEVRSAAAGTRHRLVVLSILLVAGALATMLYVQFAVSTLGAVMVGACACAIMLLAHDRVRKGAEISVLKRELARTHGSATPAPRGPTAGMPAPSLQADRARAVPAETAAPKAPRRRISVLDPEPQTDIAAPAGHRVEPAAHPHAPAPAARLSADPLRDQWSFRPRDTSAPPSPAPGHGGYGASTASVPGSTIESDLALVQRKIKALADEVNAAEPVRPASPSPLDARLSPEAALASSIDALKLAADTMRERPHAPLGRSTSAARDAAPAAPMFEFSIPATAQLIAASSPPPPAAFPDLPSVEALTAQGNPASHIAARVDEGRRSEPSPLAAAVSQAVEAGRFDVFLSPIVGLMSHDVTHYDMKVRIKSSDGGYFEDPERDLILAGGEMLALFDAARLQRAAILARRLDARGKSGSLLSDVAGPSLTNGAFLEAFARIYEDRDRIASQLVLTFSQSDCERFTPSAWQALGDMRSFGFRFALDRLRHLETDFADLARSGFAFVKLDAAALLSGMTSRDRMVSSPEACSRIAVAGLTVIADAIDSETTRAQLFGFGVLFGQGQLFGGARRISVDASSAASSAAA
ncbi:MAG: EAL domain-containing protein [Hyphomicrobium sp.]